MLSSGKETNGHSQLSSMESACGDVNHLNKHACACVLAATIISAIFGYGEQFFIFFTFLFLLKILFCTVYKLRTWRNKFKQIYIKSFRRIVYD